MIPTPKTDLFIARFQNAANKISYFSVDHIDDVDTKNQLFRAVQESYLFLIYHLYGVYTKLPNIEEVNEPRYLVYPDVLSYVLSQPITSYESVGEEFYAMVPSPKDIETYLQVFRVKFSHISLPRRSSDYFISDGKYQDEIKSAIERGVLTADEAKFLTFRLYVISLHLPRVWDCIVKMFQDYRKMGEPKAQRVEVEPSQQPLHLNINISYSKAQSIMQQLQQGGFIDSATTVDVFYYRLTGNGTSSSEQIKWIKKGKRRKNNVSKSSLVYFLQRLDYIVDNSQRCSQTIKDIFGFELSASTINRVSDCEYKEEIDTLIGNFLQ